MQVGLTNSPELEFGLIPSPVFDEPPIEASAPVPISYAAPTVSSVASLAVDEMFGRPMVGTAGGYVQHVRMCIMTSYNTSDCFRLAWAVACPARRTVIEIRGDNFGVNPDQYSIHGVSKAGPAGFAKPMIHVCDHGLSDLCDECVRLPGFNHTYIACSVPAGVGANKFIRVVVDGQANNASEPGAQFAYHAPVITSLSSHYANTGPSVTGEQQYITITGQHFGSPAEQSRIVASFPVAITMLR